MRKVYLTLEYKEKHIAIECPNVEELRDVASDIYAYDGVHLLDITEEKRFPEGVVVIGSDAYWVYVWFTLARFL